METTTLKRYGLFFPKEGKINMTCKLDNFEYEYITHIECENFIRVVYRANSKVNPEYAKLGKRDMNVGDVIISGDKMYMFTGNGCKRIPKTKELYKKIMETDEAIIEILSRTHLSEDDVNDLIENSY